MLLLCPEPEPQWELLEGTLKATPVVQLGALVLKETLKKVGLRPRPGADCRFDPDALAGLPVSTDLEKQGL